MESENSTHAQNVPAPNESQPALKPEPAEPLAPAQQDRGLRWIFIGDQGLRAGWSVLVFVFLFIAINTAIDLALFHFNLTGQKEFAFGGLFFPEAGALLALLIAMALVGLIEGRRVLDYNLTGPRRPQHFFFGLAAGFLALSALVGALAAGGWLHFGPVALSGAAIFKFGALWGCIFLVGGSVEEGLFRCYGLFTLTRGINFWWALGVIALLCADIAIRVHGTAAWGVYVAALLGFFPCLILHLKSAARSAFWYAAWVTSTLFGYVHVANPGEAWIGIFAAAFVGFVLCVSVRVTGSAWWAIGCHASWDWGETYFYGTADSGLTPHGCYLTSHPAGNPLWSGGSVGPEGSVLVLGAILLILAMALVYSRFSGASQPASATPQASD